MIWAQRERESSYHQQADQANSHDARPLPEGAEGRGGTSGHSFKGLVSYVMSHVTGGEARLLLAHHSRETTTATKAGHQRGVFPDPGYDRDCMGHSS